jgi:hypothetical protein
VKKENEKTRGWTLLLFFFKRCLVKRDREFFHDSLKLTSR